MRLTVYMMREGVEAFDDCLRATKLEGEDAFRQVAFAPGVGLDGVAYIGANIQKRPKWLTLFEGYLDLEEIGDIYNVYNSLMVLLRIRDRILALTYGYGSVALDREKIEPRFGLRTTLNAIDAERIKALDVRNIDLVTRSTRTYLSRDSGLPSFEVDRDQDIIRFAAGKLRDEADGAKMQGADSLVWTGEDDFLGLADRCERFLELYSATHYQEHFDFIDNIREVQDTAIIDQLEAAVLQAVQAEDETKLTFAYPELSQWEQIAWFKLYRGHDQYHYHEIDTDAVFSFFREQSRTEPDLKKTFVVPLDDEDAAVGPRQSLYDYTVCEVQLDNQTYILSLSKWFHVSGDYLRKVNDRVQEVPLLDAARVLGLPGKHEGQKEADYNAAAAQANADLICLDRQLFHVEGASSIEVCDLLSRNCHMVHVKVWKNSATLSHLFSQGSVSAALLNDYAEYRAAICSKVPSDWQLPFNEGTIQDQAAVTVVFAIAIDVDRALPDSLPFFSKVNLLDHKRTIERMGFKVALAQIPIGTPN